MIKNIITVCGGVETLSFFAAELAKEWEKRGYRIYKYDLRCPATSVDSLRTLIKGANKDETVFFTFNFEGMQGEDNFCDNLNDYVPFYEEFNIKVINMVVDHPAYYLKYIKKVPKNYHQINIDKNHDTFMKRFCPDISSCFIPSAGTFLNENHDYLSDKDYPDSSKRSIDILFVGNFTKKEILDKKLEGLGDEYKAFYTGMYEDLFENPEKTIDEAYLEALKKNKVDATDDEIYSAYNSVIYPDLRVRFCYRELMIRALTDLGYKVSVLGRGFDTLNLAHHENIESLGHGSSLYCLDLMNRAKITLNVMPWFKNGAHDRVFNAMLNGSVSLTDGSVYLDEEVLCDDNCIKYDLKMLRDYKKSGFTDGTVLALLKKKIDKVLNDNAYRDKMSLNAFATAVLDHTWKMRAREIEERFF